jgi:hypothetical protein
VDAELITFHPTLGDPPAPVAPPDKLAEWYAERDAWFDELMRLRAERHP